MTGFFHPLDGVGEWNRLYGSRGFLQYQFVVPDAAGETVRRVIERLTEVRLASFLAVLKRFGPGDPGPLSFPMPGWTLALDLPVGLRRTSTGCSTTSTSRCSRPAAGSTWPRTRGSPPTRSGPCTPASTSFLDVRRQVDPDGVLRSDLGRRLGLCSMSGPASHTRHWPADPPRDAPPPPTPTRRTDTP